MLFLGLTEFVCLIGIAVSLIGIIVKAFKKQTGKKKWGLGLAAFFIVLVICIAITPESIKDKDNDEAKQQQTTQENVVKNDADEKEVVEKKEPEKVETKEPDTNSDEKEKTETEKFADKYGVSVELAESIDSVLSGMKLTDKSRVGVFHYTISDVKSWKKLDDWAEGERYSGYMAEEHVWYFYIKNDTIVGVRDGNGNIYYQQD